MYINPDDVLVKRSDLPAVDALEWRTEPEELRSTALRLLAAAIQKEEEAAKAATRAAKDWELEHAVPLARKMHDTFHKYSDNYRDNTDEDLWLQNYKDRNHLVLKWVATASAALKAQEEANAD